MAGWREQWAVTLAERIRRRVEIEALVALAYGLDYVDFQHLLSGCDERSPVGEKLGPKGFWRVDKDQPPELRHTVLSLVAFHDLQRLGLDHFLAQNDGEGWMLPETLRLADYGLGHDDRAKQHQPVAAALGPRFYDWQLAQRVEESWEECERHAELIDQILPLPKQAHAGEPPPATTPAQGNQLNLLGDDLPPPKKKRSKKK